MKKAFEILKTFVWEHPAQEVTRTNCSARCKTGQPTNERLYILNHQAMLMLRNKTIKVCAL